MDQIRISIFQTRKSLLLSTCCIVILAVASVYFFFIRKTSDEHPCSTKFEVQNQKDDSSEITIWKADHPKIPPLYFVDRVHKLKQDFVEIGVEGNFRNSYGLLDPDGKLLFPPIYEEIRKLSDRYFLLKKRSESGHGLANEKGDIILDPNKFKFIHWVDTEEKIAAIVQEGTNFQGIADLLGGYVIEPRKEISDPILYGEGYFTIPERYKSYFRDRQGNTLKIPDGVKKASRFSHGMAAVQIGKKWGFINKSGELIIPPEYDSVGDFDEYGLARVEFERYNYTPFVGMIDKKGKRVIDVVYTNLYRNANSHFFDAELPNNDRSSNCGFFKSDGSIALPFEYNYCTWDSNLQYGSAKSGEKKFVLFPNRNGKLESLELDQVVEKIGDLILVKKDAKEGVINQFGETVVSIRYDSIKTMPIDGIHRILGFRSGVTDILNLDGTSFISNIKGSLLHCRENICIYQKQNKKLAFFSLASPDLQSKEYDQLGEFHDGLAKTFIGGKWGYIDKMEKLVIPPRLLASGNFNRGLAWFKSENNKFGYLNAKGEIVVQPIFDSAGDFHNSIAAIGIGDLYGFIDKKGKIVIDPVFHIIQNLESKLPIVRFGKQEAVLNLKRCLPDD